MYCMKCGTELPATANYCLNCGAPQNSETVQSTPEVWETCEIEFANPPGKSGRFKYLDGLYEARFMFAAMAAGIGGRQQIETSPHFIDLQAESGYPVRTGRSIAAHAELVAKLNSQGWEYVGCGEGRWFNYKLKRRVHK